MGRAPKGCQEPIQRRQQRSVPWRSWLILAIGQRVVRALGPPPD